MQKFWATGGRLVGGAPLALLQWAPTLTAHDPSPPITLESPAGAALVTGSATISGTGALTATGLVRVIGAATISGSSSLSATGRVVVLGAGSLAGVSDLVALGRVVVVGTGTLSGSGALTGSARLTILATGTLPASSSLVAVVAGDPVTLPTAERRTWRPGWAAAAARQAQSTRAIYPGIAVARKARGER